MSYDIAITRPSPYGLLNLRGDQNLSDAFASVLRLQLPQHVGQTTSNDSTTAFWLGPDEWLVRVDDGTETPLANSLKQAADSRLAAITVVSDAYEVFRIAGPECDDVLCQGIGIDLHSQSLRPDQCFRTAFAKTAIILHKLDDTPIYELYAMRSYATYVHEWLLAAKGH